MNATLKPQRCIVHIDMDAFYAQVEAKRLELPASVPLAVVQWNSLIAVNYAARAFGVKRFDTATDAQQKCPEMRLVHVATYAEGESEWRYHDAVDRSRHKVSLDPYRLESAKIFRLFLQAEKASIDEMYADVTDEVNRRLAVMPQYQAHVAMGQHAWHVAVDWTDCGHVVGLEKLRPDETTVDDLRLVIAATIAREVRAALLTDLGYTSTAGIAHNKAMAKLVAGLHKPNQQTVLPTASVMDLLRTTPLTKIRFLGGKLGDEVMRVLKVEVAGDLWAFSEKELVENFGTESGAWLYNICRGIDDSKVEPKVGVKSMLAAKRIHINTAEDADRWLQVLSTELAQRLADENEITGRWPKTLQFHYQTSGEPTVKSRSCPFPLLVRRPDAVQEAICRHVSAMYKSVGSVLPIQFFSLGATGFATITHYERTTDIKTFFAPKTLEAPALPIAQTRTSSADDVELSHQTTEGTDSQVVDDLFPDRESFHAMSPSIPVVIENGLSPEVKAKTLYRFFKREQESGKTSLCGSSSTSYRCPQCFKQVCETVRREHEDFHVAAQLQREWALSSSPPTKKPRMATANRE